ncbi:glycosyltransferase [Sharpea porci]|uniref:glycosyltransferase n=1 Tax=Sharpea porci TaxID=2652286 RepID=UPI002A914A66|nr:RecX family transcriptional regulator [Sharpea porci]MDY5278305.1 RecX family transcriptional regulator [Sharpea porci]
MRIGIFTDTYLPDINGVATSSSILAKELIKHGHDVLIVTTELPEGSTYQDQGLVIRVPGLDLKKIYGYRLASIYSFSGMKEIKEFDPEIIHIQTEFGVGIFGKIVGEILDIPVCYTYHTMWRDYSHYISRGIGPVDSVMKKIIEKISKIYGNSCAQLIVPSTKTKAALESYGIDNNIAVIATGLELDRFYCRDEKAIQAIKDKYHLQDKFVITFLGRVAYEKSIDFVLESLQQFLKENDDAVFMVVGDGPQLDELKKYVEDLDLEGHVVFTGAKEPSEVPSFYHASSLFVSASTTETQGLTYIEAMASGLPVLARYDKNLEDVIKNGQNGYFFTTKEELLELVEKLKKGDLEELCKKAQEDSERFSAERFYQKIITVYNKAIHHYIYRYMIKQLEKMDEKKYLMTVGYDSHETKVAVTTDTMKRYGLVVGHEINREELDALRELEQFSLCYHLGLKYLSYHDYPSEKLKKKLQAKGFEDIVVDRAMDQFMTRGLVDDYDYVVNKIHHYLRLGYGLNRSAMNLKKEGIPASIIDQALDEFTNDIEVDRAVALVKKLYNENNTRSPSALIASIKNKLFNKGFSEETVNEAMSAIHMEFPHERTKLLLEKEYDRVFSRYQRKFKGKQLKNKLITFLIQKGYSYDDVVEVVEEKWKEDEE